MAPLVLSKENRIPLVEKVSSYSKIVSILGDSLKIEVISQE
jgi:hypothetical protein